MATTCSTGRAGMTCSKAAQGSDSFEGGPGNDVHPDRFLLILPTAKNHLTRKNRRHGQWHEGVFDGGENDDGTADSDTLSFADFDE